MAGLSDHLFEQPSLRRLALPLQNTCCLGKSHRAKALRTAQANPIYKPGEGFDGGLGLQAKTQFGVARLDVGFGNQGDVQVYFIWVLGISHKPPLLADIKLALRLKA